MLNVNSIVRCINSQNILYLTLLRYVYVNSLLFQSVFNLRSPKQPHSRQKTSSRCYLNAPSMFRPSVEYNADVEPHLSVEFYIEMSGYNPLNDPRTVYEHMACDLAAPVPLIDIIQRNINAHFECGTPSHIICYVQCPSSTPMQLFHYAFAQNDAIIIGIFYRSIGQCYISLV